MDQMELLQKVSEGLDTQAQGVVYWKGMGEATIPLSAVKDGGYFRVPLCTYDQKRKFSVVEGWTYGQRLYGNDSRVRVRLAGGQQQVVFDDSNGKSRTFESSGIAEVNYPTSIEVVPISADSEDEAQPNPFEGSDRSRTMDQAQEKALRKRYEFASGNLDKAKACMDAGKVEVAQKRVDAIVAEAEAAGVNLQAREPGTAPADGPSKAAPTKVPTKATTDDKAGVAALKKADPKVKAEKKEKAVKTATTTFCLCGCGKESGGLFAPGHDARVKGMLYKVERGEEDFDKLPEGLKPYIKFAGKKASAGKENGDYRIVQAPVKFPGRDEIVVKKTL